jgi:hypothetical protein
VHDYALHVLRQTSLNARTSWHAVVRGRFAHRQGKSRVAAVEVCSGLAWWLDLKDAYDESAYQAPPLGMSPFPWWAGTSLRQIIVAALIEIAWLCVEQDQPARAALLIGGAENRVGMLGTWMSRSLDTELARITNASIEALGRDAYDQAHVQGQALNLIELIEQAMQFADRISPSNKVDQKEAARHSRMLSANEQAAWRLVAEGKSDAEISAELAMPEAKLRRFMRRFVPVDGPAARDKFVVHAIRHRWL